MNQSNTKKLAIAGILCAVAVVGSLFTFPVLASKCAPIQHMVNVLCAVLLGPWYGVGVAFGASLIRNLLGLGTIMAFPRQHVRRPAVRTGVLEDSEPPRHPGGGGLRHRHHRRPGRLSRGHSVYQRRRRHGGFLRLHRPLPSSPLWPVPFWPASWLPPWGGPGPCPPCGPPWSAESPLLFPARRAGRFFCFFASSGV